ncbi:MAG: mannose-6-phosphate isomerase [Bryobacterales bacterium]|jgi:mannose-6-phosphate isomerase|nr:mannose-6-phosphate isomerase [Bryobacterales bacterium]
MISKLATTPYDKVWGSPRTEPWLANPAGRKIGEIWFAASAEVPLLLKLLFTSECLSVQVHPNDDYAREHENSRGKTEMWHILRADPGAEVALGLRERLSRERLREASLSGEIETLLNWVPARKGDTFFVPAGTIHAIGGGLVLCEVQQLSDVTYRLYDYGRPRELHLDRGMDVSDTTPRNCDSSSTLPVECEYFRTERVPVTGVVRCAPRKKNTLYVALEGEGCIGSEPFRAGDAWEITAGSEPFQIESSGAAFLVTSEP